jgi:hypothetical protein
MEGLVTIIFRRGLADPTIEDREHAYWAFERLEI